MIAYLLFAFFVGLTTGLLFGYLCGFEDGTKNEETSRMES